MSQQRSCTRDFAALPPSRVVFDDPVPAINTGDPIEYAHVAAAAKQHFTRQFLSIFSPGMITMEELEAADRRHDELKRELVGPATIEDIRDQLEKLTRIVKGQSAQFSGLRNLIDSTSTELKKELKKEFKKELNELKEELNELTELVQQHHDGHEASMQQCNQAVEALRVAQGNVLGTLIGIADRIQELNTHTDNV